MSNPAQVVELATENLTQKQEDFARYYVESRNASTAYRLAYNVGRDTLPTTVWQEASRLRHHPQISARIEELQSMAEAHTIIKARGVFQELADIASADPNDLHQLSTYNCRYCHGDGNRYQWVDESELADAVEKVQADIDAGVKRAKMPDVRGGFGFAVRRPPNPDCVHCFGRGEVVVRITDTDKLSPKARKALKGIRMTAHGVEVTMHDKMNALEKMAQALGMGGKDAAQMNPAAPSAPMPEDVSEEQAAQAYLSLIQGQ
jgi:hypothetical protein